MNIVENEKCGIIIQARMSSKRFPKKMMTLLAGIPLIRYVYKRCRSSQVKKVLVATSRDPADDLLYQYCQDNNVPAFRGDLDNVLVRYTQAAESEGIDYIARVCGDTPFVDVFSVDAFLDTLISEGLDYVSWDKSTCVSGFYAEVVTLNALKKSLKEAKAQDELEHVTKYILDHPQEFRMKLIKQKTDPEDECNVRLTIDFPEDIETANIIVKGLKDFSFTASDVLGSARSMTKPQKK